MEDGGERDGVWTGVDGGEDGRWRGARLKGLQVDRGRVRNMFHRVSLKHASLKYSRKLALKGLQMEMILGERGVVVGGQRSCTKHVSGLV